MIDTSDYATLFLADAPMIDTRAPVEFEKGSFPTAVNLPLMTDEERAEVGTCYKQQGQNAAIELGHRLVAGEIKQQRVDAWINFTRRNPQGYLFCFRGGLRSQICQQWLSDAGCDYPRVNGGYKAMRRFLIDTLEAESEQRPIVLLTGHTGSAKTALLEDIPNSLDLEGMANHRGSAFGNRPAGQPPQISFENILAIGMLKQAHYYPQQATVLEDESRLIGKRYLPPALVESMEKAPVVMLDVTLQERVEHTFENYILDALNERQQFHGEQEGFEAFREYLANSLFKIRRRLGGARYEELEKILQSALEDHARGNPEGHRQWIEILLRDYYDPMYAYQIRQKQNRVIFSGDRDSVKQFLAEGEYLEKMA